MVARRQVHGISERGATGGSVSERTVGDCSVHSAVSGLNDANLFSRSWSRRSACRLEEPRTKAARHEVYMDGIPWSRYSRTGRAIEDSGRYTEPNSRDVGSFAWRRLQRGRTEGRQAHRRRVATTGVEYVAC